MFGLFEKKYKNSVNIKVKGMMCTHCENHVNEVLKKIQGVEKVTVSHTKGTALVESNEQLDKEKLKKAIEDIGYEVQDI